MKNNIIENIRLDLKAPKSKVSVSVRRGDIAKRILHMSMANGGEMVSLENAFIALIYVEKPDGQFCYNDCVISGDEVQYTITSQTINVEGKCKCHVEVTFEDGGVIVSPEFSIVVYDKGINQNVIKSQNEYTALTEQVVMAKKYNESAQESAEGAEQSATNAAISEENAAKSEANAKTYLETVQESANVAEQSATNASTSEKNAAVSEENAKAYEANAQESAEGAEQSATNASTSEKNAAVSEANAKTYLETVQESANVAEQSATNASTSEKNAAVSEANAKSYKEGAEKALEDLKASGQLTLGTDHSSAFYGDLGQAAYVHSNASGNPHGTTAAQVGADTLGSAQASYENAVAYTDQAIANLINGAPETLNTLGEIATAMEENEDVVTAIDAAIGTKANAVEVESFMAVFDARLSAVEALMGYPQQPTE